MMLNLFIDWSKFELKDTKKTILNVSIIESFCIYFIEILKFSSTFCRVEKSTNRIMIENVKFKEQNE